MAKTQIYLKWEEVNFLWENVDMVWESVLVEVDQAVRRGGGGYSAYVEGNPWAKLKKDIGEEKTKKVIKLYCKINGIDYEEIAEKNENLKVTASQFETFVKEGISIKVDI